MRRLRGPRRAVRFGAAVVVLVLVGGAEPAYADNCSGLADCTLGVWAAVVLTGGMLGLGLLWAYAGSGGSGGAGGGSGAGGAGAGGGAGQGGSGGSPGGDGAPPKGKPPAAYNPDYKPPQDPPTPDQKQKMDEAEKCLRDDLANKRGPEQWAKEINPTGDKMNCVEAAKAVDNTLAGRPTVAGPVNRGQDGRDLQDAYPGRGQPQMTPMGIEDSVRSTGPGSRGIVTVQQGPYAHTFNVYNDNGTIKWIDGQSGNVSTSPGEALHKAGYRDQATLEFLKTNP